MDRISNLQDELLCHVLSFLTTKEAALISVLAKRWRNLFAFVPNLVLDDSVFLHPEEGKRERDGVLQSFMDFADRVLALQAWCALFIDLGDEYRLPPELFVSKTLVKLSVFHRYDLDWRVLGISLPMLKDLFLSSVRFGGDQFEMLLPACPALAKLVMFQMKWKNSNVTVSSATLKNLLIFSRGYSEHFVNPKSISFDTPGVVYFQYRDFVAEDYPKVNLTNLVEAKLDLIVSKDHIVRIRAPNIDLLEDEEDDVFLRCGNVWKLISGIRNVQKLTLSSDTLEVLSICCESVPVFNNLKVLHIKSFEKLGWQAMPVLLRTCPHLETLVLEGLLHRVTDKCGDACDCLTREDKDHSLLSSPVKKLQIKGFEGTIKEISMIKHFLEYFRCLKKMEIYPKENVEVPESLELMMKLYSCDVQFMDKKWTDPR